MWFSVLFCPDPAVDAWQDEALAVSADLTPVPSRQSNLCCHGYFSGGVDVLLRQFGLFVDAFHGQVEERLNALSRYALCGIVHRSPFSAEGTVQPLTCLVSNVNLSGDASPT